MKVSCFLRGGRRVFESRFVASQIVIQKLTKINKTGWGKITASRSAAWIFRNVLHPRRQFTKMHLVVTGERSTNQSRIFRHHVSQVYIESSTTVQLKTHYHSEISPN